MNISKLFIKRPIGTILLTIALVLSGILGYRLLPIADLPNVDMPVIMIRAQQAGGTPEEIASSIAAPLEKRLGQIPGTNEMTSQSTQGQVRIIMQFDLSRDVNSAARDVQAALQAARADLPTSIRSNPSYFKMNPAASPIMIIAITSKTKTLAQLYDYTTNVLQQQISAIKGVGQVEIGGSSLPAVRIDLNPFPLFKYGIGFEDIRAALASTNAHTPKGFIDEGDKRYQIATNDQAPKAEDYKSIVIAYRNNAPVMLKNVAEIKDSVEDIHNAGFYNNDPSIIAVVFPQAGANIIETTDAINATLPQLRAALPADTRIEVAIDRSVTIRASLADTQMTLVLSVILVVVVVLFFLQDLRSLLIPAIVVPTSIIATFGMMKLLGYSLNNFSLMALTISTGFVVDDAIVVLENINRHIERGLSPIRAALYGAKEVSFTIISITISLIAVFVPILFMGGIVGKLFHEFAMTLAIALLASMFLSLTLTPMMCAYMLTRPTAKDPTRTLTFKEKLCQSCERFINALGDFYQDTLKVALRHPILVVLSIPATIILMMFLFITMPKGFFPKQDTGILICHLQGDQSISFQNMRKKIIEVQKIIVQDKDVQSISAFTGGRAVNQGSVFIQLTDKDKRTGTVQETVARLSKKLNNLVGAKFYITIPGLIHAGGRSSNAEYQYTLQSDSSKDLYDWMPKLVNTLQKHSDIVKDVSSDIQQGGEAIDVDILRDTAPRVQITPQLISNTLYDAFGQRAASVIYNPLNQYRVIMEVNPKFAQNANILAQTWVSVSGGTAGGGATSNTIRVSTNSNMSEEAKINEKNFKNQVANQLAGGNGASNGSAVSTSSQTMVPLSIVSHKKPALTSLSVNHEGLFVSATLSFNLAKGKSLSDAVQLIKSETVNIHLPKNISGSFSGNAAQYQQNSGSGLVLIFAAILAVYVTLGILYESYIHPITILSTLPSAGVGALLALDLFGQEFTIIALIGIILLIGIVKKNAILLVDFAISAEKMDNMVAKDAIVLACQLRFRPIMMTTIAAAFGSIPLIIASGYANELRRPLGIAIVGGLIMSQALTLYTTPVIYLYMDKLRHWRPFKRFFSKNKGQQRA
ncbi:efflux RND transporter permease subunit [Commensalibacter nepenthis]|uniref:Efflux RND transporter permease subunit n=1 Tax=Commensalibacter nepenthis TaxID=3043872 RepID=A0ABT6Q678_9PROT|nr:efflux RND transporter permease subunit [Commensalibacter sp. TBRC 10068]MDI2112408.1 efflux RND transporter permease subunit [Commensalibacter sp. TBRC 10068]